MSLESTHNNENYGLASKQRKMDRFTLSSKKTDNCEVHPEGRWLMLYFSVSI